MMPAGGAETRGHQIATDPDRPRPPARIRDRAGTRKRPSGPSRGLPTMPPRRRMVEQTRYAVEHHRVPASPSRSAPLFARSRRPPGSRRSKSDFSIFAPSSPRPSSCPAPMPIASAGASIPTTQWCRSTSRARRREPQGPVLGIAERAAADPRSREIAASASLRFPVPRLPEEGQRAFGLALAEKLGYDLQARASRHHGASVRGARLRATTCASPPVTTATTFRPRCSAPPTRLGMRSTSRASTLPIPAQRSRRISSDSMRSEAPASAPMNPSRACGRTMSFAASPSGSATS